MVGESIFTIRCGEHLFRLDIKSEEDLATRRPFDQVILLAHLANLRWKRIDEGDDQIQTLDKVWKEHDGRRAGGDRPSIARKEVRARGLRCRIIEEMDILMLYLHSSCHTLSFLDCTHDPAMAFLNERNSVKQT